MMIYGKPALSGWFLFWQIMEIMLTERKDCSKLNIYTKMEKGGKK